MSIEQVIVEKLKTLPPERQQEALDFIEFLQTRIKESMPQDSIQMPQESALKAAQRVLGVVGDDGPSDLSTNPDYMEGYGQP